MLPVFFLTIPFFQNLFTPAPKIVPPRQTYKVVDIIDGDTIVTDKAQKIRLLSVDAPETGLCGSSEAKSQLEKLVKNKEVALYEIIADNYGRLVSLVYQGKTSINLQMVKSGWGRYSSINSSQSNTLLYYSQKAQSEKIGVYSSLCRQITNPDNPKCFVKGNVTRDNRKLYFFPGCSDYESTIVEKDLGDQWFCTEREALKAGFIRSGNCYNQKFIP